MEKRNERVLAYTLARVIDIDELAEVSGGGAGRAQMTSKQTVKATNAGIDVAYDVSVDW